MAGLNELVAESPEHYHQLALSLARDSERLSDLRSGLRERLRQAPLLDQNRFVASLENAYRQIWRQWCEKPA